MAYIKPTKKQVEAGLNNERTLNITLTALGNDDYLVNVFEGESGDHVSKTICFSPDEHPEFNEWIGNEIYSWIEIMNEENNMEDSI